MIDSYKHKGMRQRLVQLMRTRGITDEKVLEAMMTIPRHYFLESALAEHAYEDRALPIDVGQTISQPYTVAYQSQMLAIKKGTKVLEIGTGSGYQCAILCQMGARVFSVERMRELHNRSKELLSELGLKPRLKWGDGTAGWQTHAPYDRILVTAASPSIPDKLKEQLEIGGMLVIPVGNRDVQKMLCVIRKGTREYEVRESDQFRFVPLIGKYGFTDDQ